MRAGNDLGNLPSSAEVADAVAVAAGRRSGTLLLKNSNVVNVFTNEIVPSDVLLAGRLIAAVCPGLDDAADQVLDLDGAYLAPGLIDGHVHLESALVTPPTSRSKSSRTPSMRWTGLQSHWATAYPRR